MYRRMNPKQLEQVIKNMDEKIIYILKEIGPDRSSRTVFDSREDAEKGEVAGKEYWEKFLINKVPMRKYEILEYHLA